ncbi:MAG: dephospho-CoA kinase [Armatimonadota bacterium]
MALVLGITGGLATGKSTVLQMLGELGAQTLSADQIAREVLSKNGPAYRQVVERFGPQIVDAAGEIIRPALAKIIFQDDDARRDLNRITHPHIIERIKARIRELRESSPRAVAVLAVEIPLLFECGLEDTVDRVLLVAAEQDEQARRLTSRSGVSPEEALRWIAVQMPIQEKVERSDYVIWNDSSIEDLRRKVESFWGEIQDQQKQSGC